jgi:hypothetical protein
MRCCITHDKCKGLDPHILKVLQAQAQHPTTGSGYYRVEAFWQNPNPQPHQKEYLILEVQANLTMHQSPDDDLADGHVL